MVHTKQYPIVSIYTTTARIPFVVTPNVPWESSLKTNQQVLLSEFPLDASTGRSVHPYSWFLRVWVHSYYSTRHHTKFRGLQTSIERVLHVICHHRPSRVFDAPTGHSITAWFKPKWGFVAWYPILTSKKGITQIFMAIGCRLMA